ncbi:MAG: hypothetical protein KF830_08295 [Planctomycetes bacterium]|nr:hypothetical protein [Planctomycetota bacterium]
MKHLALAVTSFLTLALLGGCAQQQATPAPGLLNSTCAISGEPIDAAITSDFQGGKVGFCCEKCQSKWMKLDDAGKAAAVAKHK